ncbi:MAG: hypothetical protein ACI4CT_04785 [Lachnospiraceae bacterium]
MKKVYTEPELNIQEFVVKNLISLSSDEPSTYQRDINLQTVTWTDTKGITEFDF